MYGALPINYFDNVDFEVYENWQEFEEKNPLGKKYLERGRFLRKSAYPSRQDDDPRKEPFQFGK